MLKLIQQDKNGNDMMKLDNKWDAHPIRRYKNQYITLVKDLSRHWNKDSYFEQQDNVTLNGCVVWLKDTDSYTVFVTIDLTKVCKANYSDVLFTTRN